MDKHKDDIKDEALDEQMAADNAEAREQSDGVLSDKEEAERVIERFADEDEDDMGEISLKSILGGDILGSKFFLKQVMFVMFCVVLMILYTGNRYSSQQDAILIDSLRGKLQSVKYNVMTQSSELMNMMRQSNVEKMLRTTKDSVLRNPVTPPYLIKTDEDYNKPLRKDEDNDPNLPTGDEG